MQRSTHLKPLRVDEEQFLNEQAEKLFKICDVDEKGFVVRSDLVHLEGLIEHVDFVHLDNFFDANDTTRTGMVRKDDFVHGIKQLIIQPTQSPTPADFRKHKLLRDLPRESFKTISLETDFESERPCTKGGKDMRSKLKIKFTSPCESSSSLWGARGLVKMPSEITPSPSNASLFAPVHVYIQDSSRSGSPVGIAAPLSDNPEVRNHSELLQRSSHSHSDLFRLGSCDLDLKSKSASELFQTSLADELKNTERLYKVVFVGDSAVGKSCFLHRFCHNRFKPLFNATIGVDFTIKHIQIHNRVVSVQLWDTAGQERFRSITKQYFRKADAVVLVYDVTSEDTFLNVRNWIQSIKTGVDDGCVMCLVGNKIDLCPNDQNRTISYQCGKELAEEFDMIYFETSAYTGMGINDCMKALAVRLLQRDEENADEALKLEMYSRSLKRSWCCV